MLALEDVAGAPWRASMFPLSEPSTYNVPMFTILNSYPKESIANARMYRCREQALIAMVAEDLRPRSRAA